MPRNPDGPALLGLAREALLRHLMPALPQEKRLDALLIAKVLEVTRRELENGDVPFEAELDSLCALLDESRETAGESRKEAIERLRWRLAAEIRGGRRDGDRDTHQCLHSIALLQLSESNPRLLKPKQGE